MASLKELQYLSTRPTTPATAFYSGGQETAYGRRQRRMQEDWDARHKMMMELQANQRAEEEAAMKRDFEIRDQQMQEDKYRSDMLAQQMTQKLEAEKFAQGRAALETISKIDPRTPEYNALVGAVYTAYPLATSLDYVRNTVAQNVKANEGYVALYKDQQERADKAKSDYAESYQKLAEVGVTPQQMPQYFDTSKDVPAGTVRFDPIKVNEKLGVTSYTEKQTEKKTETEKPIKDAEYATMEAAAKYNQLLLDAGDNTEIQKASSELAGARARYKSMTGKDLEIPLPKVETPEQLARIPAGVTFIGPDGKPRKKRQ